MLDLTTIYGNNLFEIKLLDGKELKLRRPTQAMYLYIMDVKEKFGDEGQEKEALTAVQNLFLRILNRNIENITYTEKDIENYEINIMTYVIRNYFDYWNKEVQEQVNFQ